MASTVDEGLPGEAAPQGAPEVSSPRAAQARPGTRLRVGQLEALYSISRTVNASLELSEVLQRALEQMLEVLGFRSGVIRLLDAAAGELILAAHAGLSRELREEIAPSIRLGAGISGLAAQRRAPVFVEDLPNSPYPSTAWVRHGYRTLIAVPLQSRGMLLGCFVLAHPEIRPVDEAERELLMALVDPIGMALANAELYTAAQRKIQYLSALHECSRDIGPAPDLERVYRLTTERMALLLGLDRTAVIGYSAETGELKMVASYPLGGSAIPWGARLEELPAAAAVLQGAQPYVSSDPIREGLLPPEFVQTTGMRSVLAAPLIALDQRIGLLVGDGGEHALTLSPDELELAMIFANKAAMWIANARLFAREHEARSQAEVAETRFRALLESAPDGIISVDREGKIVLVNSQAEQMFGYDREALLGQPVEILMPERLRTPHIVHRTHYEAAPTTRPMGVGLDLVGRRKDGSEFPVDISLSPLQSIEGLLVTSIIRDITQRKQAQDALARQAQELARSNAELEQFAYVASHDLQEPLRMVSSYTQLVAKRYRGKLDSDADEFIAYAIDGVTRMQQLINDLLAYSRVRTKGKEFELVDCRKLIESVLANLQTAISENGATVTYERLPVVMADPSQLTQLFQNLIANAIKFHGEEAPRVQIAAERRNGGWQFSVRDNGIGIEPEYIERIFLIFQRLHSRADYPGTGIGLAICKRIVERHGGKIWVESQPGARSTFFFTIPAR